MATMADAPKDRGQWRRNSPSAWIRQAPPVESALTAPSSPRLDANIHASEYQLYLPSKEELQKKLMAWTRELET
ncbi:MAG TPA: hypothetical protein DDY14_09045 [Chromatiaceae bacterium]|nr:hypothetical protein [Chromatiaceae bacterium]HCS92281.1 hypothetical protein [Chromatiaceae bacterium]